jgi:hypothetical protein
MDEFDEKREKKVIKFFKNWDHNRKSQHEDDKYRWYSSENLWIASEDSTRDWWVMFETFLLRVYYLNSVDDVDCKTCLCILMQSRNNDKMLQPWTCCTVWDVGLQWWCNMRMEDSMHNRNGAYDTMHYHDADQMMHTPWCKDDDACDVCT